MTPDLGLEPDEVRRLGPGLVAHWSRSLPPPVWCSVPLSDRVNSPVRLLARRLVDYSRFVVALLNVFVFGKPQGIVTF